MLPVILRGVGEAASRNRTTVENQDAVEGDPKGVCGIAFLYRAGDADDLVQVPRTAWRRPQNDIQVELECWRYGLDAVRRFPS